MVGCHDLRIGDVLECPECHLLLEVKQTCNECNDNSCGCDEECNFECCGVPLVKK